MRGLASVKYSLCENAVWWLVITKASRAESISSHSRRPVALLLPLPERERKRKKERKRERWHSIHVQKLTYIYTSAHLGRRTWLLMAEQHRPWWITANKINSLTHTGHIMDYMVEYNNLWAYYADKPKMAQFAHNLKIINNVVSVVYKTDNSPTPPHPSSQTPHHNWKTYSVIHTPLQPSS